MSYPREDLVGRRFDRLVVIGFAGRTRRYVAHWKCYCDCGERPTVAGHHLKAGTTKSCGCLVVETMQRTRTKHGLTGTTEYRLWCGMLRRCYNPNEKSYPIYGGRGITVCDRWRGEGGFENFLADMGKRPPGKYELERKKNHLGYSPKNCCWATKEAQSNNRRTNILVVLDGKRMTLKQACDACGLKYHTTYCRMRSGLTFAQARRIGHFDRLAIAKARNGGGGVLRLSQSMLCGQSR